MSDDRLMPCGVGTSLCGHRPNLLNPNQSNTMNKVAEYTEMYPDVKEEIGWFESYQYISYKPPKHMKYHSDNHAVRNPKTGFMYVTPYLRRITALTYLNDDFTGGALDFRYWKLCVSAFKSISSIVS